MVPHRISVLKLVQTLLPSLGTTGRVQRESTGILSVLPYAGRMWGWLCTQSVRLELFSAGA